MKLIIDYSADSKGFDLKQDLNADIANDAEGLGYITYCLHKTAVVLSRLLAEANPKYHNRIAIGVARAKAEEESEGNTNYPFTTMVVVDEPKDIPPTA